MIDARVRVSDGVIEFVFESQVERQVLANLTLKGAVEAHFVVGLSGDCGGGLVRDGDETGLAIGRVLSDCLLEKGETAVDLVLVVLEEFDQGKKAGFDIGRVSILARESAAYVEGVILRLHETNTGADILLPVLVDVFELVAGEAGEGLGKGAFAEFAAPAEASIVTIIDGAIALFPVEEASVRGERIDFEATFQASPNVEVDGIAPALLLPKAKFKFTLPGWVTGCFCLRVSVFGGASVSVGLRRFLRRREAGQTLNFSYRGATGSENLGIFGRNRKLTEDGGFEGDRLSRLGNDRSRDAVAVGEFQFNRGGTKGGPSDEDRADEAAD